MRFKISMLSILLIALLAGSGQAAIQSINVNDGETILQDQATQDQNLSFHMELGQIRAVEVQTKEGPFTRLIIPGFHSSKTVGSPELPMINKLVAIPFGAQAHVVIDNVNTRTVKLSDYGITSRVMPVQPSLAKNQDPNLVPFYFDKASYEQTTAKANAELVQLAERSRMRAQDFARLEISPVEYLPGTDELRVVESIDFRVVFSNTNKTAGADLYAVTYSPFFEHLYAQFVSTPDKGFHDSYPDRVADHVTMVVVTPPMFASQLEDYIQWKTERGFEVITAVTGSPEVGTTTSSIRTYLHGLYNNATVENPAPSFVVFVGDVAQMPTFQESGDATDRPYCAVDGDLVPDMFYGRLSATNPTELQAILDKTMMYDQYTMPDPSYLSDVVMIAGADPDWAPTHGNGQINYGTTHYFNAAHGLNSNTYLYPASSSSDAQIIQHASDGVAFINYTAHGNQTSWGDPTFTQSNIRSLNNINEYCLAIGNCCLTGTYDYSECFGETWLRVANKGAIGYIGGSNNTLWDEDYYWGVGYHNSNEINGTAYPYADTGLGAYDGLFHDHSEAATLHYVTNDAIIFAGNLAVMESGSSNTTYYWNIYNLSGDPSISTYLGVPEANNVVLPGSLTGNQVTVAVSADVGSYIGLTQDGVLIGSGTVPGTGTIDITLKQSLQVGLPVKAVIMAQNRVPYITEIAVASPVIVTIDPASMDAGVLTNVGVTVMDSDGTTPVPNVAVSIYWPLGLLASGPTTDSSGYVEIPLAVDYGCELTIIGRVLGAEFDLFSRTLSVNGLTLDNPSISVATEGGLTDMFSLNLASVVTASCGTPGFELVAIMPDGSELVSTTGSLDITPTETGNITTMIRVSGYDLYSREFGILTSGSIRGRGYLADTGDNSGIIITASPGDATATTDAAGNYHLLNMDVGSYVLSAAKDGYKIEQQPVSLGEGAHLSGVNFILRKVEMKEICNSVTTNIPDNQSSGVSSTIDVVLYGEIASVSLDLNLTHTYIGDLTVKLTAPDGTEVVLHNKTGGSANDLIGNYPADLEPVDDFSALVGLEMSGQWTLFVSDTANRDTGSINEWCLNIGFVSEVSAVEDNNVPQVVMLNGNYPNPFNPETTINFTLPRSAKVNLSVFDLRGRMVKTLVNGSVAAGSHDQVWRGTDESGHQVSSGTYFYRLVTDSKTDTGKMLLLK